MSQLSDALVQLDRAIARRAASPRLAKGREDRVMVGLVRARDKVLSTALLIGDADTMARVDPRELQDIGTSAALATIRAVRR